MASRADIELHYSDDFDFYHHVLGETSTYSCADWSNATTLEHAQEAKLQKMLRFSGVNIQTQSFLDLGCGWGSAIKYITEKHDTVTKVTGITNSSSQALHCIKSLSGALVSIVEDDIFNYLPVATENSFDSAVSIGAFEHFASQKDYKSGTHIERYRTFLKGTRRIVSGRLGLQTIITLKNASTTSPIEASGVLRLNRYIAKHIFPNSITPPLTDLIRSLEGIYHIDQLEVNTQDYAQTIYHWKKRLVDINHEIPKEQYDRFYKYFDLCQRHFESGYLGIARLSLVPVK